MIPRIPVICTACKNPITDLETFGALDTPMCWSCHSTLLFDEGESYDWILNLKTLWFLEEDENHDNQQ